MDNCCELFFINLELLADTEWKALEGKNKPIVLRGVVIVYFQLPRQCPLDIKKALGFYLSD